MKFIDEAAEARWQEWVSSRPVDDRDHEAAVGYAQMAIQIAERLVALGTSPVDAVRLAVADAEISVSVYAYKAVLAEHTLRDVWVLGRYVP